MLLPLRPHRLSWPGLTRPSIPLRNTSAALGWTPGPSPGLTAVGKPLLLVENKEYPRKGATATLCKTVFQKAAGRVRTPARSTASVSASAAARALAWSANPAPANPPLPMMVVGCSRPDLGPHRVRRRRDRQHPAQCLCAAPARAFRWCFRSNDSLNPRFTAARAIADPLLQLGDIRRMPCARAARNWPECLGSISAPVVGRPEGPHPRIARAIALHPKLVVLDEPTAALDVSVQAVVLNLLQDLKASLGMSYLFVSHDLNVVRLLCDRVIVMRTGRIVEQGPSERVLGDPQDAYTRGLLTAIPGRTLSAHPDRKTGEHGHRSWLVSMPQPARWRCRSTTPGSRR